MNDLTKLLEKERRTKAAHHKVGMTRHSRFGTTIAVKSVSSLARERGEYPLTEISGRPKIGVAQAECDHGGRGQDVG